MDEQLMEEVNQLRKNGSWVVMDSGYSLIINQSITKPAANGRQKVLPPLRKIAVGIDEFGVIDYQAENGVKVKVNII